MPGLFYGMPVIRWLLVPVSAFAVWIAALLLGVGGINALDSLCPPDLLVSGLCTAWWYQPATTGLEMMCAGMAAAGVVSVPAQVAPAHRIQVATIFFIAGAVFTTSLALAGDLWKPSAAAALSGTTTLYVCVRRWRAPR